MPRADEVKDYGSDDSLFIHTHDNQKPHRKRDMQFVRSGYLIHLGAKFEIKPREVLRTGAHGYVYYLGIQPSKATPVKSATYKGTWDFTTEARRGKSADQFESPAGSNIGATPENSQDINVDEETKPLAYTSEFTADFSQKKLTGKLTKNGYVDPRDKKQTITDLYQVEATMRGNRFIGKATALKKDDPYFGQDGSRLEGGFYGDKAQELAGKFLTDDRSLFVVFAAKRDSKGDKDKDNERRFDADKIHLKTLTKSEMDTYGQATYLVIEGVAVPLIQEGKTRFADMDFDSVLNPTVKDKQYKITVCCNNLDYVKFGTFEENNTRDGYQYLIGERTAIADMPKGYVHYRGT